MTIYVFRGEPDFYHTRHVLLYFTSPSDADFHETVHVQRSGEKGPWEIDQIHQKQNWVLENTYLYHLNLGALRMPSGQEMAPVNIVATTPLLETNDDNPEWNCQNFLYGGLQRLVQYGLETQDWFDHVQGQLMDLLIEGTVDDACCESGVWKSGQCIQTSMLSWRLLNYFIQVYLYIVRFLTRSGENAVDKL